MWPFRLQALEVSIHSMYIRMLRKQSNNDCSNIGSTSNKCNNTSGDSSYINDSHNHSTNIGINSHVTALLIVIICIMAILITQAVI